MSDKTGIEWCDATWNAITGCTKVSEGCRNCYALTFAERWRGTPGHYFENGFDLTLRPDKLDQPLKWTKPRKIFVNSMSDLFHEAIDDKYIAKIFGIMALAQQHTFQVLTKRPQRMMELLNSEDFQEHSGWFASQACREYSYKRPDSLPNWPNPNIWLGTSVENQKAADERIPLLLQTPAVVRFLSCEPLLGSVDLTKFKPFTGECFCQERTDGCKPRLAEGCPESGMDWVIVGGESGHGARPMNPEWARSLRDQCQAAGVSYFFKQWGQHIPYSQIPEGFEMSGEQRAECDSYPHGESYIKGNKKLNGRLLDGKEWNEFPNEDNLPF